MKKINNFKISREDGFNKIEVSRFDSDDSPKINVIWLIVAGLFIGFVNGFWGGGGGMICVPILVSVLKLPEKVGHATTILVMLPLCVSSLIIYLIGKSVDLSLSLNIGIGFILGGIMGALLLKKINNNVLKILFAIVIIAGGIKLVI